MPRQSAHVVKPTQAKRREHWDSRAGSYDSDFDHAPVRARAMNEVMAILPDGAETVIDAGTGTGRAMERLVQHFGRGSLVVAQDFSMNMLRSARHRVGACDRVAIVNADYGTLPFRTGSVDLIVTTFTLHHIPSSQQLGVLREFHRVLRRSGSLVLADQIQSDPPMCTSQMKLRIAETFYPHVPTAEAIAKLSAYGEWPLSIGGLVELVCKAGFGPTSVHRIGPIVAVLRADK